MRNLLEFFQKYNFVFLFIFLEIVSFALLFCFNSFQGSVALTSANTFVASVDRIYGDAAAFTQYGEQNTRLSQENTALQIENAALRAKVEELGHEASLSEKTVLAALSHFRLIPAKVVSNSNNKDLNNYLIIDKGRRHGVKENLGVVAGGGVVGIVYLVGERYSLVIPVVNRKTSISCRVRGQDYFGYLGWEGGNKLLGFVDDIPRYAEIERGAIIETSGYSEIFPPGIFIGRVLQVNNSPDGQSYRLDVNLGTDFAALRDVSVIATSFRNEVDTLRNHAAMNDGTLEESTKK